MCGLTTAKTPCFGAPIINCGGTPLVCPAFAGTCRGAMLFEIICLKILSMQPKTRYGLQFRSLAFASTQVHFLGRVPALSIQRQNRRKSTEAKLILIPKERVIRLKPQTISNFFEKLVVLSPTSVLLTGLSGQLGSQITPTFFQI